MAASDGGNLKEQSQNEMWASRDAAILSEVTPARNLWSRSSPPSIGHKWLCPSGGKGDKLEQRSAFQWVLGFLSSVTRAKIAFLKGRSCKSCVRWYIFFCMMMDSKNTGVSAGLPKWLLHTGTTSLLASLCVCLCSWVQNYNVTCEDEMLLIRIRDDMWMYTQHTHPQACCLSCTPDTPRCCTCFCRICFMLFLLCSLCELSVVIACYVWGTFLHFCTQSIM